MKNKIDLIILFICCAISLMISLRQSIYISTNFTNIFLGSNKTIYSGEFWIVMDWLRLVFLSFATFISLVKLFKSFIGN